MLSTRATRLALALAIPSLACQSDGSAVFPADEQVRTFTFEVGVDLAGTPEQAWSHFTGDISPWWDHTFSDQPEHLVLDARVGGSFYETFDKEGNGAEHARVIYAERPKMIRMDGPLGLSGLAVHMVYELRFSEREGGGSRIDLRVQGVGSVDDELVETVKAVWTHFLVERFEPYHRQQVEGVAAKAPTANGDESSFARVLRRSDLDAMAFESYWVSLKS